MSNHSIYQNKSRFPSVEEKQNIEGVNVFFDQTFIAIQKKIHEYSSKSTNDFLLIDRHSHEIVVKAELDTTKMTKRVFSAFLGVVNIQGYKFVVLCDQAKISTNVDNIMIFQVASLYFLSYLSDKQLARKPERKDIFKEIRELYQILRTGFYFSYKYNLTQSFQYQSMGVKNRFTWNLRFFKELEKYKVDQNWGLPLIQGYVNSFNVFIEGTKVSYILISRRSNRKAGTRYFDRGVDEDGYVANFVHTEQIVKIEDFFISDVQIRGSVPIFFEQKGLRTLIKLTRGYELTHQIYKKHMDKLRAKFQRIFFVNLLCMGKRGQKIIIQELEKHIKEQKNDHSVKYMYYDFHKSVSDGNYANVNEGIEKVRQMKTNLGYYIYDSKKGEVLQEPAGVFRTNCLDCLDRTNFFQAKLALITLQDIFKSFNINCESLLEAMDDPTEANQLIKNFRNLWADNGDMISFHYTGTGSTHTDITREGKRGLAGNFIHKYKSVARFYNQNFWDFHKMNLVDLLLGQNISEFQNVRLPTMVQERENEFCQKSLLDIYLFSWKVPKKAPKSLTLFPTEPDLIAISLQQVSQVQKWNKIIKQAIDQKYVLVGQKFSNNNLLKIYVKQQKKAHISNVQLTKVKFKSYFNQYMSSKCAIVIRFSYESTKIVFCGCQLQYGRQFSINRIKNLKDLHQYAFQEVKVGEKKSTTILDDDVIFLFGNMNTHISPDFKEDVRKLQPKTTPTEQRRLIQKMIDTDEFNTHIRQALLEFRQYEEEDIMFPPTYKFNGKQFDGQRSGWPDRIWYSTSNKIICSHYSTVEELRQGHVPVAGQFQLQTEKIDYEVKARILEQIVNKVSTKEQMQEIEQFEQLQKENTEVVESLPNLLTKTV